MSFSLENITIHRFYLLSQADDAVVPLCLSSFLTYKYWYCAMAFVCDFKREKKKNRHECTFSRPDMSLPKIYHLHIICTYPFCNLYATQIALNGEGWNKGTFFLHFQVIFAIENWHHSLVLYQIVFGITIWIALNDFRKNPWLLNFNKKIIFVSLQLRKHKNNRECILNI